VGIRESEGLMTSAGFTLRATTTASTKRSPTLADGKVGVAVEHIASFQCYPPVQIGDPALVERYATKAASLIYETFAQDGLDILAGDIYVEDSTDYLIVGVNAYPWPAGGGDRLHVIIEGVQTL